jgi:hypothetical protein
MKFKWPETTDPAHDLLVTCALIAFLIALWMAPDILREFLR